MAHIYRLIIACAFLCAGIAHAAFTPSATWKFEPSSDIYDDSAEGACLQGFAAVYSGNPEFSFAGIAATADGRFACSAKGPRGAVSQFGHAVPVPPRCPANSTQAGSSCTCDTGYKEVTLGSGAKVCQLLTDPTADEACSMHSYMFNVWKPANSPDRRGIVEDRKELPLDTPFLTCMPMTAEDFGGQGGPNAPPGCKHKFTPQMRYRLSSDEPWRYEGDSWALGPNELAEAGGTLACVPGLDEAPGDPPIPRRDEPKPGCERGIPGQVNGVEVCIDPSSGRTEGVDWTQVTDAEGRTREIKHEVKCEGEKCTVTTTNKAPGSNDPGNVTTTTTTRGQYCAKNPESSVCKGDKDNTGSTRNQNGRGGAGDPAGGGGGGKGDGEGKGFCEENPNSPQCKESSFGGSCQSNFTCDGDAIQCAIAKEQHIRACKMFDDPSPESLLYEANKGKEGNQTGDLPGNETVSIAGRIDMTNALGAGSCVSDRTVTVWGRSVVLPFSAICPSLAMFGQLLVAVSLLLAARIVMRG